MPENIDPQRRDGEDVHVQFATVAEAIKRLEQMIADIDRRLEERVAFIKDLIAEADRRYSAEFMKLSSVATMMTEHQALALAATKEAVAVAMSASDKAVAKAEAAAEKRFESVNEFRAQLTDQQSTFARADLVNQRADALDARITDNKDRIASMEARGQAYSQGFGWLVAFTLAGAAAATLIIRFMA